MCAFSQSSGNIQRSKPVHGSTCQRQTSRPRLGAVPLAAAAIACLVAFGGSFAHAQSTLYWTGASGTNWNSTSWTTDTFNPGTSSTPVNGDTLGFRDANPTPTAGTKIQNNDFTNLSVAALVFSDSSHPTGFVLNGNKLTLTGATPVTQQGRSGLNTINLDLEIDRAASFGIAGGVNAGLLTINGVISENVGPLDLNLSSNAALLGLNTFSGKVTLGITGNLANITINTLSSSGSGSNQSLGTGSLIQFGNRTHNGTLTYTGGATSTDKGFQIGEDRSGNSPNGGGSFINNGSGAVTWTGTQTRVLQGQTTENLARNFTLGGSNTGNNNWQSAIQNNLTAGSTVSLTKTGVGKWILSGSNTYTGATSVEEGTLLVNGSTAAGSAVSVNSGAVFGGNGTVNGNLTLASGALFAFDTASTLDLTGTLALENTFGVASLRDTSGGTVDWANINQGTYTLMNTGFSFNTGNISNFGVGNQATGLAGGKSAYFQQGTTPTSSLELVVVPEPTALALTAAGAALSGLMAWRRRRG